MSSKKVKMPSVERLVWKTILMIFLMFFASTIFISLDDNTYSPLVPIVS